jgi:50S ribosomal protein L16 3-hydroxylase
MDLDTPLPLLGGLSPHTFMRRHWQKKPLLVRAAVPGMQPLLPRAQLFALAGQEAVQSRLVEQVASTRSSKKPGWKLRTGPFTRRQLPAATTAGWTLLVQGVDLHHRGVHDLLQNFRFVPDARLDDLMISWASPGGGVGPHFDSYDVFLLQASGQRRWRIGRQKDLSLQENVPLKILQHFAPEEEYVLGPGDMLYLPPRWAHDGVAVDSVEGGDCMTYSIGFRAPSRGELAHNLLARLADDVDEEQSPNTALYADAGQSAVAEPARIPPALLAFAQEAVARAAQDTRALQLLLGEYLTEPKAHVQFDAPATSLQKGQALRLHARSRMMFDEQHIFINGEALHASGADARLMRELANARQLGTRALAKASPAAQECLQQWFANGWLEHETPP